MSVERRKIYKYMKKKNILITGSAGYLGSIIATKLVNLGHNVTAVDIIKYDKNSLSHLFYFDNFKFLKEDVTKKEVVGFTPNSEFEFIIGGKRLYRINAKKLSIETFLFDGY